MASSSSSSSSSHRQKMILIALILAVAIPISSAHKTKSHHHHHHHHHHDSDSSDETEQTLRDLCSDTDRSDDCWDILKSELHRFDGSNDRDVADRVIDLAADKSKEIRDKLKQWYSDSDNDDLKKKYHSCSKNYDDVEHSLKEAHKSLDSDDHGRISDQVDDAEKELEKCEREYVGDSFDPPHVGDRNKELRLYLDMVRAASERLEDYDEDEDEDEDYY